MDSHKRVSVCLNATHIVVHGLTVTRKKANKNLKPEILFGKTVNVISPHLKA